MGHIAFLVYTFLDLMLKRQVLLVTKFKFSMSAHYVQQRKAEEIYSFDKGPNYSLLPD